MIASRFSLALLLVLVSAVQARAQSLNDLKKKASDLDPNKRGSATNRPINKGTDYIKNHGYIAVPGGQTYSNNGANIPTRPYIDPLDGSVYSGTLNGNGRGTRVNAYSPAALSKRTDGRWWWSSNYSNNGLSTMATLAGPQVQQMKLREEQQIEAERRRREQEAQFNFRIDDQGRAYADNAYLGQARRVVNNETGRTAWRYDIPNGFSLIRNDGQNVTSKHTFKKSRPNQEELRKYDRAPQFNGDRKSQG